MRKRETGRGTTDRQSESEREKLAEARPTETERKRETGRRTTDRQSHSERDKTGRRTTDRDRAKERNWQTHDRQTEP